MTTTLITGANRGIGLETARQLASAGHQVLATCRRTSPELEALAGDGVTVIEGVDVADEACASRLADAVCETPIDWLVLNAGRLTREGLDDLDLERLREQFEVNSLGPLRVTQALRSNLRRGSRIGIVTSLMGSMEDNGSGGYYGYRMSKAAVNAAGVSLARDLEPEGIAVGLLHPGMVATEMTGGRGIAVEDSVRGLVARMEELELSRTGSFRHVEDGRTLPF